MCIPFLAFRVYGLKGVRNFRSGVESFGIVGRWDLGFLFPAVLVVCVCLLGEGGEVLRDMQTFEILPCVSPVLHLSFLANLREYSKGSLSAAAIRGRPRFNLLLFTVGAFVIRMGFWGFLIIIIV